MENLENCYCNDRLAVAYSWEPYGHVVLWSNPLSSKISNILFQKYFYLFVWGEIILSWYNMHIEIEMTPVKLNFLFFGGKKARQLQTIMFFTIW